MESFHAPLLKLLFRDSGPTTEEVLRARDAMIEQGDEVSENLLRNMLALSAMRPADAGDKLVSRKELAKLARIPDRYITSAMIEGGMMEYRHANHVGKLLPTEKGAAIALMVERTVMYRAKPALAFLAAFKRP